MIPWLASSWAPSTWADPDPVGTGRVVYLSLRHDMRAWGEPSFRRLVRQAMTWAAAA